MAFDFVVANSGHVGHLGDDGLNFVHVVVPHILVTEFGEATSMEE
jgi:hypothetical protein